MPNPQNMIPRKKGDPPLPGAGRPKGSLNSKTILAQMLGLKETVKHPVTGKEKKMTQLELINLKQLEKARKGDLGAYNALLDRFEGRPEQKQINEFPDGTEINLTVGAPKIPGQPPPPAEPEPDAEV